MIGKIWHPQITVNQRPRANKIHGVVSLQTRLSYVKFWRFHSCNTPLSCIVVALKAMQVVFFELKTTIRSSGVFSPLHSSRVKAGQEGDQEYTVSIAQAGHEWPLNRQERHKKQGRYIKWRQREKEWQPESTVYKITRSFLTCCIYDRQAHMMPTWRKETGWDGMISNLKRRCVLVIQMIS